MENLVPHSLQFRVIFLPISLSTLALHRLQWTGWPPPPYGAKSRPHSAHGYGSAGLALGLRLEASRPARGGLSPRFLARWAATCTLVRAILRARFFGSASCLRQFSALRRRVAAERHASEQ